MKYKGRSLRNNNYDVVVIPRFEGSETFNIVFKVKAVVGKQFESICPAPAPPMITRPGKPPTPDLQDDNYLQQMRVYSERRYAWTIWQAICDSEDLEFEKFKPENLETYEYLLEELQGEDGLSNVEFMKLLEAFARVNSLDESVIEEARSRFLDGQAVQESSSSPKYRTDQYMIWRACERFKILPPGLKPRWEDLDLDGQASLLAYEQIRGQEDAEDGGNMMAALFGAK